MQFFLRVCFTPIFSVRLTHAHTHTSVDASCGDLEASCELFEPSLCGKTLFYENRLCVSARRRLMDVCVCVSSKVNKTLVWTRKNDGAD